MHTVNLWLFRWHGLAVGTTGLEVHGFRCNLSTQPFDWTRPGRFGLAPNGAPVIKEGPTVDELNLTFWPYTLAGFGMAIPSTTMMFHNYNILGQMGSTTQHPPPPSGRWKS
ncbi:MAG: hypothetical protein OXH85_10215 [Truepera sp.]|nr:hypothetical protein [Truepera sp.]